MKFRKCFGKLCIVQNQGRQDPKCSGESEQYLTENSYWKHESFSLHDTSKMDLVFSVWVVIICKQWRAVHTRKDNCNSHYICNDNDSGEGYLWDSERFDGWLKKTAANQNQLSGILGHFVTVKYFSSAKYWFPTIQPSSLCYLKN